MGAARARQAQGTARSPLAIAASPCLLPPHRHLLLPVPDMIKDLVLLHRTKPGSAPGNRQAEGCPAAVRCRSDVIASRFQGRRRRHGHEHGDHGDGLLGERLLRALRLRQAALRAPPPQVRPRRRARRRGLRRPSLQRGARDPRAGAVPGEELPDGQARRRHGKPSGAGGVAVKILHLLLLLLLLLLMLAVYLFSMILLRTWMQNLVTTPNAQQQPLDASWTKQSWILATIGPLPTMCTVCLEEYAAKDVVRVLLACGHAFHAACIDAWLRQHPTCPVCRASLRATKNHRDHSLAAEMAQASRSHQVPASSSSDVTASPPQPAADQLDSGLDSRLEIVSEEPASSADQQQTAGVVDRSGSGCGETARPSASEHL